MYIILDAFFVFCVIMLIVSASLYGIEPVVNAVDTTKTKSVNKPNRRPMCRNGKITKVEPERKVGETYPEQTITIELENKETKVFKGKGGKSGFKVGEMFNYNLLDGSKCYGGGDNDQVIWNTGFITYIGKDEKVPQEMTFYYNKDGKEIGLGKEYTNNWLWSLITFGSIVLLYLIAQAYYIIKPPKPETN